MPSVSRSVHEALVYTFISLSGATALSVFSVWWFDKMWRLIILITLGVMLLLFITAALIMVLYIKVKSAPPANPVTRRTSPPRKKNQSISNLIIPGVSYKIRIVGRENTHLCVNKLSDNLYTLGTSVNGSEFVLEAAGNVTEMTVRPSISYFMYTLVNGVKYYACTTQVAKDLHAYTVEEVEDIRLYFRPRQSSTDPAIRDTQFRLWPYHVLDEHKWEYDSTYEVEQTDEIYLSFLKPIRMNHGCTLDGSNINYDHMHFSLLAFD